MKITVTGKPDSALEPGLLFLKMSLSCKRCICLDKANLCSCPNKENVSVRVYSHILTSIILENKKKGQKIAENNAAIQT